MAVCQVCFRHCAIAEGKTGFCGGRICRNGEKMDIVIRPEDTGWPTEAAP